MVGCREAYRGNCGIDGNKTFEVRKKIPPPIVQTEYMTGSPDSIRDEVVALLPRLRRFARLITRHREDADDLVQLGVERALTHAAQWRSGTRVDSWMFRIMKNAWIDEVRGRSRRAAVFAPEEAGENIGVSTTERQIERLAIEKAMARLSEEQRLAVGLVLVEGLPYKDAAEALEIPIGTLTSRLARGREALQQLLGGTR
jgi:RNA polymerase sigma-70 factor (ECF subfamily)